MATANTFWKVVKGANRDNWGAAGLWLGYTVMFGLLPIWLAILGQLATKQHTIKWLEFIAHGEVLLFCTSLVANTTRLMTEQPGKKAFVRPGIFQLTMWFIVLSSTGLFAAAKVLTAQNIELDAVFVSAASIVLWLSSVGFSFLVVLIDSTRLPVNLEKTMGSEQKELSAGMDAL